jgi:hypothetical protein
MKTMKMKKCYSYYSDFSKQCQKCPFAEECLIAMFERVLSSPYP